MMINEKVFSGLSVMAVANLLQIPFFSQYYDKSSMKHLLHLQLWHLFKYTESTVVKQND